MYSLRLFIKGHNIMILPWQIGKCNYSRILLVSLLMGSDHAKNQIKIICQWDAVFILQEFCALMVIMALSMDRICEL